MTNEIIKNWFQEIDNQLEFGFYYHKFANSVPKELHLIGTLYAESKREELGYCGFSSPISEEEDNEEYCKKILLNYLDTNKIYYKLKKYTQLSLF